MRESPWGEYLPVLLYRRRRVYKIPLYGKSYGAIQATL